MTRSPDVLVVGGGIVGLCTALVAADRGLCVTIADETRLGAASRASAGMLAPSVEGFPASVHAAVLAARDYYPAFLAGIVERSDIHVPLDRRGILEIAASEAELASFCTRRAGGSQILARHELSSLEPALAAHHGALYHPLDGSVDPTLLMDALSTCVARHPGINVVHHAVISTDVSRRRPRSAFANGDYLDTESLVVATGAWGSLAGLPQHIPVRPVKGELLTLDRVPVHHVVYSGAGYLVPRGEALVVGATSEEVGFAAAATSAGHAHLRAVASSIVPDLAAAAVLQHWAGLRPCSLDGLPLLGADPDVATLFYACGFSRNGILLGPWAADILGSVLVKDTSKQFPSAFAAARFRI